MRDITQLHPSLQQLAAELQAQCLTKGISIKYSECLRTVEEQDALYAQGRTLPGNKVTNAKGTTYSSQHQWGIAVDFYLDMDVDGDGSKADDAFNNSTKLFDKVGETAVSIGLGWGGNWTSIVDKPHLYLPNWGSTTQRLKEQYGTPEKFMATWQPQVSATEVTYKAGDRVIVSSHYVGCNDDFNRAVPVNPWLEMEILDVVAGARNPYHTNHNTYCNSGDIRGYAEDKTSYNQHVHDFQWACNQDGIRDDSGNKLKEDGIWGTKSNEAAGNVVLCLKNKGKYTNLTSWMQCRIGTPVTGIFDEVTERAVLAYQNRKGLTPDGKAGCMTLNQIVRDCI